jgi:ATPase subunit of ABC transporter with duplicated ATPase domains
VAAYRGALIVAGHDLPFLSSLGITRWLLLDGDGLRDIAPDQVPGIGGENA